MMKKRIAAVLLTVLLLSVLSPAAAATDDVDNLLTYACTYGEKVDLSAYGMTLGELRNRLRMLWHTGENPWYYTTESHTGRFTCWSDEQTGLVTSFQPKIADRDKNDYLRFEERLEEILAETVFPGMSQWQIALSAHDYLAANSVYDEQLVYRTDYDLLTRGTSVCVGYAKTYQWLMQRCGIPCVVVNSPEMNHAWNLVQIGDQWYHVDVTWDDPVSDIQGRVSHDYFLLTDEQISQDDFGHYGWTEGWTCSDPSFTDAFWRDVKSAIIYTDANQCFFLRTNQQDSQLIRRSADGTETLLREEEARYVDVGFGTYCYSHFGLSLWDNRLWMGDTVEVFSLDLEGGDKTVVYSHPYWEDSRYIVGLRAADDTLYLSLRYHDGDWETAQVALPPTEHHDHAYTTLVVEPTCYGPGKTVFSCTCGISGQCAFTPKVSCVYEVVEEKDATVLEAGYRRSVCKYCGDEILEEIPRLLDVGITQSSNSGSSKEERTNPAVWILIAIPVYLLLKPKKKQQRHTAKSVNNREK